MTAVTRDDVLKTGWGVVQGDSDFPGYDEKVWFIAFLGIPDREHEYTTEAGAWGVLLEHFQAQREHDERQA